MHCHICDTPLEPGATQCPTCHHRCGSPSPAPKGPPRWLAGLCAGALLVALVLGIFVASWRGGTPSEKQMGKAVITYGDFQLTNTELGYYFWSEYFYLIGSYANQVPATLDLNKPLQDQMYDQERTWQEYILERTLETVSSTMSLVFAAQEAGFTLPEDYEASLQMVAENFQAYAHSAGFLNQDGTADVEAYLVDSYGTGATVASFMEYLRCSYLAAAYSDALYYSGQVTQAEISDYYDQYAEDYQSAGIFKDETRSHTLRTILIAPDDPENQAHWDTAKESAENLYATWQAEAGTEDDFGAMAAAHSDDPSTSGQGGLLQNITPAELTGDLATWVADEQRVPGDSAVVQSQQGWVIAYYVSTSEQTRWQQAAEEDLRRERYQNEFAALTEQYRLMINKSAIAIATPAGLYDGSTSEATGTATGD